MKDMTIEQMKKIISILRDTTEELKEDNDKFYKRHNIKKRYKVWVKIWVYMKWQTQAIY